MTQSKSRIASRITAPLTVVGLAVLLGACSNSNGQNSLEPKGPAAEKIDNLFIPILMVAIVIGVLVVGATVFIAIRFRQRDGQPGNPKQIHGHTALEIGWTIVPALILAVVAVPTVATIWDLAERPTGPKVLKVEVTGQQWWWSFQLSEQRLVPKPAPLPDTTTSSTSSPEKPSKVVFVTSTELHIPVNTKVDLALNSSFQDVIHSFWVPELAGKKDVMPARTNRLTIEASKPGTYLGACAEFCGLSHARMRFRVIAEPMADWIKWRDKMSGPPAQAITPEIEKLVSETYLCTNCHVFDDTTASPYGPNLTHFADRSTFAGGSYETNPKNLRRWLLDAPSMVEMPSKDCRIQPPPPNVICRGMPSFTKNTPPGQKTMTEADANTLVQFLIGEK